MIANTPSLKERLQGMVLMKQGQTARPDQNHKCRSVTANDALKSDGSKAWESRCKMYRTWGDKCRTDLRLNVAEDKKTTLRWKRP